MNRLEHLLVILMEECDELSQDTAKALRFGVHEQRDLPTSNAQRMNQEYNDLAAVIGMINAEMHLQGGGAIFNNDADMARAKRKKVEKYLKYSEECGTLGPLTTPSR